MITGMRLINTNLHSYTMLSKTECHIFFFSFEVAILSTREKSNFAEEPRNIKRVHF